MTIKYISLYGLLAQNIAFRGWAWSDRGWATPVGQGLPDEMSPTDFSASMVKYGKCQ